MVYHNHKCAKNTADTISNTLAPVAPSIVAIALPIPRAPPVTMQTGAATADAILDKLLMSAYNDVSNVGAGRVGWSTSPAAWVVGVSVSTAAALTTCSGLPEHTGACVILCFGLTLCFCTRWLWRLQILPAEKHRSRPARTSELLGTIAFKRGTVYLLAGNEVKRHLCVWTACADPCMTRPSKYDDSNASRGFSA